MCKTRQSGFTQIELIVTIVLIGILSAVALPRFYSETGTEGRGFADEVSAALRFAQKTAIASRRTVCAALTAKTIQLSIASTAGNTTCDKNLSGPTGKTPHLVDASGGNFRNLTGFSGTVPGNLYFDTQGRPVNNSGTPLTAATTLSITGGPAITIEAETGHVHF